MPTRRAFLLALAAVPAARLTILNGLPLPGTTEALIAETHRALRQPLEVKYRPLERQYGVSILPLADESLNLMAEFIVKHYPTSAADRQRCIALYAPVGEQFMELLFGFGVPGYRPRWILPRIPVGGVA